MSRKIFHNKKDFSTFYVTIDSLRRNIMRFSSSDEGGNIHLEKYVSSISSEAEYLCDITPEDDDDYKIGCYDDEGIMCFMFELEFDEDGRANLIGMDGGSIETVLMKLILKEMDEDDRIEESIRKQKFERLKSISEQYDKEVNEDDEMWDDFDL